MPFLVDSVMAELAERQRRGPPGRASGDCVSAATPRGKLTMLRRPGPGVAGATRARASSTFTSSASTNEARAQRDRCGAGGGAGRRAPRRRGLEARCSRACASVIADLKTNPPPIPVDEIAEAIQFLEWLVANNFTSARRARLRADRRRARLRAAVRDRPRRAARRTTCTCCGAATSSSSITPEIMEFLHEPQRAHHRQGQRALARSPPRLSGLYRRQAFQRRWPADRRIPHRRPVHVDRLHRIGARHSLSAPQGRSRHRPAPASRRRAISGKALVNVLETYPRDELFQIDDDQLYEFAQAILYLDERPRVRVLARHGSLRPLRLGARLRAARALRQPRPCRHRQISGPTPIRAGCRHSIRITPKGRWSASTSSSAAPAMKRRHPDAPRWKRRSTSIVRTWMDRPHRCELQAGARAGPRARDIWTRYRTRVLRRAIAKPIRRTTAVADIQDHRRPDAAERPLAVNFHRRHGDEEGTAALKVWSFDRPIPLSERVPVLENMGFRVVDEHTYHVCRPAPDAPDFWLHDMMLEVATARTLDISGAEGAARSALHDGDARACRKRRLQRAGADRGTRLARHRAGARGLALSAPDPHSVLAGLHVGDAGQACGDRREDRRSCSTPAST